MKRLALFIFFALAAPLAIAQTDNTFYAKGFAGPDVGTKVANAQMACSPNTSDPCFIILDPSLATSATGTMPTKCGNCYWIDYRDGLPWGTEGGGVQQVGSGTVYCIPYWVQATYLGNSPVCYDSGTGTEILTLPAGQEIVLSSPKTAANGFFLMTPNSTMPGTNNASNSLQLQESSAGAGATLATTSQGSGYQSGQKGTCTVNGGTFTQQATCGAMGNSSGGLQVNIVNPGLYSSAPTSLSITGLTQGSGFTYTLGLTSQATTAFNQQATFTDSTSASAGPELATICPGNQPTSGPCEYDFGAEPIQNIGSFFSFRLPSTPNLLGLTKLIQDMDALTQTRVIAWADAAGTPMVQFVAGANCGGSSFAAGVLTVACSGSAGISNTSVSVSSGTQAANTCSSPATATMTGVATSGSGSHVTASYLADPTSLVGWAATGGMTFHVWPSAANTVSWIVCNQTASSISYSAITLSIGAQ